MNEFKCGCKTNGFMIEYCPKHRAAPDMYEALRYALSCFRKLSEEGHYPQFMLAENDGKGFRPITTALEKVDGQDYSHGLDDLSLAEGKG